ncbi:hypothetical protein JCM8202_000129 [Rhodotorula sphaerocarpa]
MAHTVQGKDFASKELGSGGVRRLAGELRAALQKPDHAKECLELIRQLKAGVKPQEELIRAGKIGVLLNKRAAKDANAEVATAAQDLIRTWKAALKRDETVSKLVSEMGKAVDGKTSEVRGSSAAADGASGPSKRETLVSYPDLQKAAATVVKPGRGHPLKIVTSTSPVTNGKRAASDSETSSARSTHSPPPLKKLKDDTAGTKGKPTRSHLTDNIDRPALYTSGTSAKQKILEQRAQCFGRLYDALAEDSDAPTTRLVELALGIEIAAWAKSEGQKSPGGSHGAYTSRIRSLYQHIRSPKTPLLRSHLVRGELTPQALIDMSPADFRTAEQAAHDAELELQAIKSACFSEQILAEEIRDTVKWRAGGR